MTSPLPSNVQSTAFAVARVRAAEAALPESERLFDDPFAAVFDDGSDAGSVLEGIPFFRESVRIRTRYFDDVVREALGAGIRSVVIVGAGMDTRAVRMPEIAQSGTEVIELDLPGQLEAKWQTLAAAGTPKPDHVCIAAMRIGEGDLEATLRSVLGRTDARVLWVCEGLLGYLSLSALEELTQATFRVSGPGSRLTANYFRGAWSTEVVHDALSRAGWKTAPGPSFEDRHRCWIGERVPEGGEGYALVEATRDAGG